MPIIMRWCFHCFDEILFNLGEGKCYLLCFILTINHYFPNNPTSNTKGVLVSKKEQTFLTFAIFLKLKKAQTAITTQELLHTL